MHFVKIPSTFQQWQMQGVSWFVSAYLIARCSRIIFFWKEHFFNNAFIFRVIFFNFMKLPQFLFWKFFKQCINMCFVSKINTPRSSINNISYTLNQWFPNSGTRTTSGTLRPSRWYVNRPTFYFSSKKYIYSCSFPYWVL